MKTKEIKLKIKSVGNIKKITKTMEMVSISKMRRAVDKALATKAYSHYALELLVNLSRDKNITHPLMLAGKENKELLIVITSNQGLCGGYHTNIFKALFAYLKRPARNASSIADAGGEQATGKEIKAVNIGKYGEKICRKLNLPVFASFTTFNEHITIEQTKELSDLVRKEYLTGDYRSVKILYTEFLKSTTYKPVLREIFPLSVETIKNAVDAVSETEKTEVDAQSLVDYKFEPDLNTILENILPGLVDIVIYQTLAEAFASEHSSRMFAMRNAGDSATTILQNLTLSYNRARQDGITKELSEIVAGAEALQVNS